MDEESKLGTWGNKPFENDAALDWLEACLKSNDLSVVQETIETVNTVSEMGYVDSDLGCEAIAAITVVAAVFSKSILKKYADQNLRNWISTLNSKPTGELCKEALSALKFIMSEKSELDSLWRDSPNYIDWINMLNSLKKSLEENV